MRAVAISGGPRSPSKSKTLAEMVLESLRRGGVQTHMIDVAMLPADGLLARGPSTEIEKEIAEVGAAQIVVAATPTYRALYTGALKAFFDLMPPGHLVGKICVPVQTAASPVHFLAIDYGFKPLFASLDGIGIPGVYATDEQFVDGKPDEKVQGRIAQVAGVALELAVAQGR
jgi:FMN reductase